MRLGQLCSCVGKSNKWPCVGFCALTRGRDGRTGRPDGGGRTDGAGRPAGPARPGRGGAIPTMPTSAKSRGVSSMPLSRRGMWSRCAIVPFHGFHGMVTRKSILLRGPRGPSGPSGPRGTEPSNHGTGAVKRATRRRFVSRFGVFGASGDPCDPFARGPRPGFGRSARLSEAIPSTGVAGVAGVAGAGSVFIPRIAV
jgi:hypothetical protein